MQLHKVSEIDIFMDLVQNARGNVWLETLEGDRYNLKSTFSRYIALGELISNKGDDLLLFCSDREDENTFIKFFNEYPDTL